MRRSSNRARSIGGKGSGAKTSRSSNRPRSIGGNGSGATTSRPSQRVGRAVGVPRSSNLRRRVEGLTAEQERLDRQQAEDEYPPLSVHSRRDQQRQGPMISGQTAAPSGLTANARYYANRLLQTARGVVGTAYTAARRRTYGEVRGWLSRTRNHCNSLTEFMASLRELHGILTNVCERYEVCGENPIRKDDAKATQQLGSFLARTHVRIQELYRIALIQKKAGQDMTDLAREVGLGPSRQADLCIDLKTLLEPLYSLQNLVNFTYHTLVTHTKSIPDLPEAIKLLLAQEAKGVFENARSVPLADIPRDSNSDYIPFSRRVQRESEEGPRQVVLGTSLPNTSPTSYQSLDSSPDFLSTLSPDEFGRSLILY